MATFYKLTKIMDDIVVCTEKEVQPKNGKDFSLEELQGFVEGYIEIVKLRNGYMVVNDEGKLLGLPMNVPATSIYQHDRGLADIICGNVLVCDFSQIK